MSRGLGRFIDPRYVMALTEAPREMGEDASRYVA